MSGDQHWQQRTSRLGARVAEQQRPEQEPPAPVERDRVNRRKPARLRLHYADGTIGLMSYAFLVEVLCTSHQHLTLVYTNAIIHMTGARLDLLLEDLALDRASALTCHNPRLGHAPPTPGEPLIKTMQRLDPKDLEKMLPKKALD